MEQIFVEKIINAEKPWLIKVKYGNCFTSSEAREAFEQSNNMYWKIDGSCGILRYDTDEDSINLYQRIDTRGKEPTPTLIPLPSAGKNPSTYTSHTYYMEKVALHKKDGKKQKKNKQAALDILDRHKESLKDLILSHHNPDIDDGETSSDFYLSVEIVGTKYNQTPGVNVPVAIAPHSIQKIVPDNISATLPRDFEQAQEFFV